MIRLSDFDYSLPQELIAQMPSPRREDSRLMIVNRAEGSLQETSFKNIIDYLSPGDVLVLNDAKVIPARLWGRKSTGGTVEIFLLEPRSENVWEALVRPAKRIRKGTLIALDNELQAEVIEVLEGSKRIFRFNGPAEALFKVGQMPLPPYIAYDQTKAGYYEERYQTVYASKSGAVAAPTAGLHFSEPLLKKLEAKGVKLAYVTLYVGLGTFKPIEAEDVTRHQMHVERYELSQSTIDMINGAKLNGNKVVAVGTTAVRVLEGVTKNQGKLMGGTGRVNLFIYPGFRFQIVDRLITNFHLPKSSLLVLVGAFAGTELIRKAYQKAIEDGFRFYSFGDAMLIV